MDALYNIPLNIIKIKKFPDKTNDANNSRMLIVRIVSITVIALLLVFILLLVLVWVI